LSAIKYILFIILLILKQIYCGDDKKSRLIIGFLIKSLRVWFLRDAQMNNYLINL